MADKVIGRSAFLAKCEAFLLHPSVRALSLADRVDFLEHKGLTADEITACLKNIQGRGTIATGTAATLPSLYDKPSLFKSMVSKFGLPALATVLLGVGYYNFRQRMLKQAALNIQMEFARRRARRQNRVAAMLDLIQEQQKQYKQAASALKSRVFQMREGQRRAAVDKQTQERQVQEERERREMEQLQAHVQRLRSALASKRPAMVDQSVETEAYVELALEKEPVEAVGKQPVKEVVEQVPAEAVAEEQSADEVSVDKVVKAQPEKRIVKEWQVSTTELSTWMLGDLDSRTLPYYI